jgi:uncharacterized protein
MNWVFADTNYYLALFGPRDQHHTAAILWSQQENLRIVTTEFVVLEIGNSLTRGADRALFVGLERSLRADRDIELVPPSSALLARAVDLFANRPDKNWSLTDCTSFLVMQDRGKTDALTADQQFVQMSYRALLLEMPKSD